MKIYAFIFLLLTACSAPRYYDCPNETRLGADAALAQWESAADILQRADVFCQAEMPFKDIPCVTWWYGTGTIPGQRAKIVVFNDLAGPCMIHELHHGALYVDFSDGCTDHQQSCGWNELEIEEANDLYKTLIESETE